MYCPCYVYLIAPLLLIPPCTLTTLTPSANAEFAVTCLDGVTQPDGAKMYVKHKTKKGEGKGDQQANRQSPRRGQLTGQCNCPIGRYPMPILNINRYLSTLIAFFYGLLTRTIVWLNRWLHAAAGTFFRCWERTRLCQKGTLWGPQATFTAEQLAAGVCFVF